MSVPDGFWTGEAKLAWPMDDVHRVFAVFPTLYLSFAVHNDPSQAFSLAVTPQVSPEPLLSDWTSHACMAHASLAPPPPDLPPSEGRDDG